MADGRNRVAGPSPSNPIDSAYEMQAVAVIRSALAIFTGIIVRSIVDLGLPALWVLNRVAQEDA